MEKGISLIEEGIARPASRDRTAPEANPEHRFLHYHWGRLVFRVISFSKACTIHPGTLESICDFKAYDQLYKEIKREEIQDNPPQQGGSSASGINRDGNAPIDAKVEDVVSDIIPTSPTYSESLGASHDAEGTQKKRWVGIASGKEEAEEDHNYDELPDFEDSLDTEDEALKDVVDTQESLDKLDNEMETIMSNLQ